MTSRLALPADPRKADMQQDAPTNGQSDPGPFGLHHDAWGRLVLTDLAGQQHVGVAPVRAFPISDPAHGVSICDADGHEILWIANLDALPAPVRRTLEDDLAR